MDERGTTKIGRTMIVILLVVGVVLCGLALSAEVFNLNFTPGFGIIQMFQLLVGITMLTVSAYMIIRGLRGTEAPASLQADIGVRLTATGLLFAYAAGLSDLLRIGTHVQPRFERPYVGPLQLAGLAVGIVTIILGLWLYYTSRSAKGGSSLEFLLRRDEAKGESAEKKAPHAG
jgi:hypothetical protein